jgi:WD40 repeat protein
LQKRIKDVGRRIDYAPDGTRLATWSVTLSQIQVDDGSLINTLTQHIGSAKELEFMPDGNNLAIGSYDHSIYIRRVSDGALHKRFYSNDGAITALDVSSDGAILVSGSAESLVRIWNVDDGSSIGTTGLSGFEIEHISISHDNQYAISSIWDGGLALWRVEDGALMESGFGFGGAPFQPVTFSPTEMVFATMVNENGLGLWSSFDVFKVPQQSLTGPTEFWAQSLAYSPDGNLLAVGGGDQVWIWRIADGALVLQLDEAFSENAGIEQVEFSPDGKLLAAISSWKIYLWNLSDGELLHTIDSQYGWLNDIAFSPDGRYLAVGSSEGVVRLWGIPSPQP